MKAVALFSGGKDSLYALHIAKKQGIIVDDLITLLPTLPWPSPHAENIQALKVLSESMGKNLKIVDLKREIAFIEALKDLEIDGLIAGDINVEAHLRGLQDVCSKVGIELIEPLYGRDTLELYYEIFGLGFKALITGVNLRYMDEEWLGFTLSKDISDEFLSKIGAIDPLGENGEFHTLVLDCPLYSKPFTVGSTVKKTKNNMAYLSVSLE